MHVEHLSNIWVIFGLSIVFGCLAGYCWARYNATLSELSHGKPTRIRAKAKLFHERVSHFREQISTLEEHSNEYTAIFEGSEWHHLVSIISHLEQVDTRIQHLIGVRDYAGASEAIRQLYAVEGASLDSIQTSLESYAESARWESTVRGMLKRVVLNIEAATHETKQLSQTERSRKRRPTLVTLADVKKSLLEDEAFSP